MGLAAAHHTGQWPRFDSNAITPWDDFNLDTLNESYGHILDLEVPAEQLADAPRVENVLGGVEINKPNDILHLVGWNDLLLLPTLAFAKHHLNLHASVCMQHYVSAPASSSPARISDGRPSVRIDHRVALDDFPLPNLVIGLGRLSSKFQGERLAAPAAGQPVRRGRDATGYTGAEGQAAGPAASVGTEAAAAAWRVALMPVPWTRHGERQLTTEMALWWLCMLALSAPQYRALAAAADVVGIGEWEVRRLDDERGWVRCHRYSNVEQPADPPPPPAYEAPSPSNPAAFSAAVGIRMDPTFDLGGDFGFESFDTFLNPACAMGPVEMPPTTTD